MTPNTDENEIDIFISRFLENPRERPGLVAGLIHGAGRLTLNVPGIGVARRIAERLHKGPFSDYYEFEKLLARSLHPLMAGLNLNVVSDLQVNALFSDRYPAYSRDLNMALASGKKLSLQSLKPLIVKMTAAEGHYMVIKFYDLVLRGIDAPLCRALKPVESAVIRMKYALGDDEARNRALVVKICREFREGKGDEAARLLQLRMEWDEALRAYIPGPADSGEEAMHDDDLAGDMITEEPVTDWDDADDNADEESIEKEDAAKPAIPDDKESIIARYARLIRQNYLDAADTQDAETIRGIVKGIYIKNEKVYDRDKAADVVREVLAIWLADESLNEDVRGILEDISREEGAVEAAAESEFEPEAETVAEPEAEKAAEPETEPEIEPETGLDAEPVLESEPEPETEPEHAATVMDENEGPVIENEVVVDEEVRETEVISELPDDAITISEEETTPIAEETAAGEDIDKLPDEEFEDTHARGAADDAGVSDGEMEALLSGISDEAPPGDAETAPQPEAKPSEEAGVSDGELDALLAGISDEVPSGDDKSEATTSASHDDPGVSGGELEALLDNTEDDKPAGAAPVESASLDVDEVFEPVPHETPPVDAESFVVKDEILFEDKSLVKKAGIASAKPHKVRISMREIADTESRKNLLDLMELLANTDSAADISRYLVGAGVTPAIKYGVNDLAGCNDFAEAFERITGSEIFDYNEKIIILEKWLKPAGRKKGWFDPPHEENLALLTNKIEAYAGELNNKKSGLDDSAGGPQPDMQDGNRDASPDAEPVEIPEKPILKTGDESIRISREIYEFQSLYRAGAGKRTIAKRLPGIQGLFNALAAGKEAAVHFAVYHRQDFTDFLRFLDDNPELKELLDVVPAMMYCKKKKIL